MTYWLTLRLVLACAAKFLLATAPVWVLWLIIVVLVDRQNNRPRS